jgi:hypothetical protein
VSLSKTYSDLPLASTRISPFELLAVDMAVLDDGACVVVEADAADVGGAAVEVFLALLPQAARTIATPTMAATENVVRREGAGCIVISSKGLC